MDRVERGRVDPVGVRQDLLEHLAHLQVVGVALIVEDVAPGERGVVEVPDERLLAEVKRREAIGIDLGGGRIVNPLQQVRAVGGRLGVPVEGNGSGSSTGAVQAGVSAANSRKSRLGRASERLDIIELLRPRSRPRSNHLAPVASVFRGSDWPL